MQVAQERYLGLDESKVEELNSIWYVTLGILAFVIAHADMIIHSQAH